MAAVPPCRVSPMAGSLDSLRDPAFVSLAATARSGRRLGLIVGRSRNLLMPRLLQNFRRYPIVLRGMYAGPRPPGIHFLLYHKVSGELPFELDLTFRLFRRQMKFLYRTRRVIAYEEAVRLLYTGVHLPRDLFVLTFDDGYED